jgi:2-polyprenyl-3-methyl-5-hydroxy-6-metoxy-1,4-benzoquinol methylase
MPPDNINTYYQDPTIAASYDRERFSNIYGRIFDKLEKRSIKIALERVLSKLPNPEVLDVPCGTGRITETLLGMNLNVTAADISPEMIQVAKSKCVRFGSKVRFQQLDLSSIDSESAKHDLVTCVRLFHHLDHPDRCLFLQNLARLSRQYVLVNMSYSSTYYDLRRKTKRLLKLGTSKHKSTMQQILQEAQMAQLSIVYKRFVLPLISEDIIMLFRKT